MEASDLAFIAYVIALLCVISGPVSAAVIDGRLYDYSLSQVRQGIVEIDTVPIQRHVTVNGSYSFDVPKGNYTIIAQSLREGIVLANATQTIVVEEYGSFNLDLILLPVIDEPSIDEEIDVSDVEHMLSGAEADDRTFFIPGPGVVSLIAIAAVVVFFLVKAWNRSDGSKKATGAVEPTSHPIDPRSQETPQEIRSSEPQSPDARHDLAALIRALKEREGRATQKELRKDLPFSEAKVSLMVSELEHEGKVTKIRKGRGNIIILK